MTDTKSPELEALAVRVEALTGACRETDDAIALACGFTTCGVLIADHGGLQTYRDPAGVYVGVAPRYTASLDAAMTLVPEGSVVTTKTMFGGVVGGHVWVASQTSSVLSCFDILVESLSTVERRMTMPCAITAAALRARATGAA